jgi:G3E family GTPase
VKRAKVCFTTARRAFAFLLSLCGLLAMSDAVSSPTLNPSLADARIPVTVLTGFLGSGKTTLVNRILTENHGKRIAVIENEFGEVGIDDALVIQADEEIFEMNNGCVCCTVRGDLIRILNTLLNRKSGFDAILIETTGLANPAPVAQTFFMDERLQEKLRLDSFLAVVDSYHVYQQLKNSNECKEQIAFADRILLNKTDLITPQALDELELSVRALNPVATIYRTQQANLPLEAIFNQGTFDLEHVLSIRPQFLEPEAPFEWAAQYRLEAGRYQLSLAGEATCSTHHDASEEPAHTGEHVTQHETCQHDHRHHHDHHESSQHPNSRPQHGSHEHTEHHHHSVDCDHARPEEAHDHHTHHHSHALYFNQISFRQDPWRETLEKVIHAYEAHSPQAWPLDGVLTPSAEPLEPPALKGLKATLNVPQQGDYLLVLPHTAETLGLSIVRADDRASSSVQPEQTRRFTSAHHHDDSVTSVGIEFDGDLEEASFVSWLQTLLTSKGADIYRCKGIVAIAGEAERFVFQGVHMMMNGQPYGTWGDQPRRNRFIFIGKNLDRQSLTEGILKCRAKSAV